LYSEPYMESLEEACHGIDAMFETWTTFYSYKNSDFMGNIVIKKEIISEKNILEKFIIIIIIIIKKKLFQKNLL
jgi:hypothetical protein